MLNIECSMLNVEVEEMKKYIQPGTKNIMIKGG